MRSQCVAVMVAVWRCAVVGLAAIVGIPLAPAYPAAAATTWQDTVGAQTSDKAIQALAFLPTELWINAGDTVRWAFPTGEIHTLTLGAQFGVTPNTEPAKCNNVPLAVPVPQNTLNCAWDGIHEV